MKRILIILLMLTLSCMKEEIPVFDTVWTAEQISTNGKKWIDIDTLPDSYQCSIDFAENTQEYITSGFLGDYRDVYIDRDGSRNLYVGSYLYMSISVLDRTDGIVTRIKVRGGTVFYLKFREGR